MHPLELISRDLCPFVQRVVIALSKRGVPFVCTHVDLDNRPPWFTAISPSETLRQMWSEGSAESHLLSHRLAHLVRRSA